MDIFSKKSVRDYSYILDFCSHYIKIVRAIQEREKIFLDNIFALDLEEYSQEEARIFFSKLFQKQPNSVKFGFITRKDTTIKYIDFPSTTESEIEQMISFQIEGVIPYSISDISFDFQIQPSYTQGFSKVMAVIAHQKKISKIVDNFQQYNINLDSIALDIDGLRRWYNFTHGLSDASVGVVDVDIDKVNFIIIKNGTISFSRSLPISSKDIEDSNNRYNLNRLRDEIVRSITAYKRNNKESIEKLTITGAETSLATVAKVVRDEFEGNMVISSCFDDVPLAVASEKIKDESAKILSFSYLMGMVLPVEGKSFEFLPQDLRVVKEYRAKKEIIKKAGIALLGTILVGLLIASYKFYSVNKRLKLLNEKVRDILPRVETVREEVILMRRLSGYLENKTFSLEIIYQVYSKIPEEVKLTRLEYTKNKKLNLRGQAFNMQDVFKFVNSLQNSAYFRKVSADNVSVDERGGRETVIFEINCNL